MPASAKIPILAQRAVSDRARRTLDLVEKFVNEDCIPAEPVFEAQLEQGEHRWISPQILEDLKVKAKDLGLWNMFLSKEYKDGAGFSNLEYGLMAESLGRSKLASEATNNSAPDTGNMELLAKYGNEEQKQKWLLPLLEGKIRSAFVMTEPDVASSDATNVRLTIEKDGDSYILNGQKWWISNAGDPRCKVYIIIGKTDPSKAKYNQQSMIIVPAETKGITVERMLSVYGFDDAPHGHGHLRFENSERALEWMLARANDPRKRPFGKMLSEHGVTLERIAMSRIEIDAARLIVLNAAMKIDEGDAKSAMTEIGEAKILVPNMACAVIDRAIQSYGAEGVSQDTPMAAMWSQARIVRIADGPDDVHIHQMGRNENKRGLEALQLVERQARKTEELFTRYRISEKSDKRKTGRRAKL
ncbi:hypothetical protein MMC08_000990 [Hypocenomyce scalaris]|nr:hypothetical protein [Hypocenomyce scalaris]